MSYVRVQKVLFSGCGRYENVTVTHIIGSNAPQIFACCLHCVFVLLVPAHAGVGRGWRHRNRAEERHMELTHSRVQFLRGKSAPRRRDSSNRAATSPGKLEWKVASSISKQNQPPVQQVVLGRKLEHSERSVLPRSSSFEPQALTVPQVSESAI